MLLPKISVNSETYGGEEENVGGDLDGCEDCRSECLFTGGRIRDEMVSGGSIFRPVFLYWALSFLFCMHSFLFILFRIPGVFLYLSGSRQKKNIQILRRKREEQKKKGFSLQGKIDMEFLRKRSEEKQEEKRRMAEQAPWKQEGEATAKLLMPGGQL